MGEAEDELINDPIDAHSSTDQFESGIFGVVEDEMVTVKVRQFRSPDTSSQGRDVVDIGLLDHSRHGLFHRSLTKLIQAVLFPDLFEIEERPAENWFQKAERTRMRY